MSKEHSDTLTALKFPALVSLGLDDSDLAASARQGTAIADRSSPGKNRFVVPPPWTKRGPGAVDLPQTFTTAGRAHFDDLTISFRFPAGWTISEHQAPTFDVFVSVAPPDAKAGIIRATPFQTIYRPADVIEHDRRLRTRFTTTRLFYEVRATLTSRQRSDGDA